MGAIQGAVNKVLATGAAATAASPKVQTKAKERTLAKESEKASKIAEQSKVELPGESVTKSYPMPKNKAQREELQVKGSQEIEQIKQSMKANKQLGDSLEALYQNNPTDENFKKLMDFKATNAAQQIPLENRVVGIQQRMNFIEPDSIQKRKLARERANRRKDARKQQQDDLIKFLDKNPNAKTTELSNKQKKALLDMIAQGGGTNGKK